MLPLNMQMLTCTDCGGLTPLEASRTCLHCDTPLRRPPRWAIKLTALLGPAGALLLAACYGGPGRYVRDANAPDGAARVDKDGDGALGPYECSNPNYVRCRDEVARRAPTPDIDCDDEDRARYPGAQDPDGDGIDQNCDGVDGWGDAPVVGAPPAASPPATIAVPPPGGDSP